MMNPPAAAHLAREIVINTVRVNNQFEDGQRMHFVRKARRLWWAFAVLELLTVGVLALIVYQHEPTPLPLPYPMLDPVFGGIIVYLTGALVGVFNWAFQEANTSRSVEDYGLFRAELFVSMGLSGIAAVGGVLVTVMLAGTLDASVVQPRPEGTPPTITRTVSPTATRPAGSPTVQARSVGAVFVASGHTQNNGMNADPAVTADLALQDERMKVIASQPRVELPGLRLSQPLDQPVQPTGPTEPPGTLLPTPAATPGSSAPPSGSPTAPAKAGILLGDPFTLARYPYAVLLAIIFGFSPRLLIDRLTKSSSDLTRDFKSIQAV